MYEEEYKRGVQELKAGNTGKASKIFEDILIRDEKNEKSWFGLAICTNDDDTKILRLNNVLSLNPNNKHALNEMEKIRKKNRTEFKETLSTANDTNIMKDIFQQKDSEDNIQSTSSKTNANINRIAPVLTRFFYALSFLAVIISLFCLLGLVLAKSQFAFIWFVIFAISASLFAAIGKTIDYLDQITGHLKSIDAKFVSSALE